MKIINARIKGKSVHLEAADTGPKRAEVVDLMDRLRASLEGTSRRGKASAKASETRRKTAASKSGKLPARDATWRRLRDALGTA